MVGQSGRHQWPVGRTANVDLKIRNRAVVVSPTVHSGTQPLTQGLYDFAWGPRAMAK